MMIQILRIAQMGLGEELPLLHILGQGFLQYFAIILRGNSVAGRLFGFESSRRNRNPFGNRLFTDSDFPKSAFN